MILDSSKLSEILERGMVLCSNESIREQVCSGFEKMFKCIKGGQSLLPAILKVAVLALDNIQRNSYQNMRMK